MNQRIKDIAFWIMILTIISLVAYLLFFIKTESYQCMISPLTYGVSKYEVPNGDFYCTCGSWNTDKLIVTKDTMSIEENPNSYLGVTQDFLLPNS